MDARADGRWATWRRWARWLPTLLLLSLWLPSAPTVSEDWRLEESAGPLSFRLLDWEATNLTDRAGRLWSGLLGQVGQEPGDREVARRYFEGPTEERASYRAAAEAAIERSIARAYLASGVGRTGPGPALFPPVLIAITAPPQVIVASPRSELRVIHSTMLRAALTEREAVALERSADSTGVSSLVAPIGGVATYPAMVLEQPSAGRVVTAAAHEWVHHYLIFFPLGSAYWSSQSMREVNETVADLVAEEIAPLVLADLGLEAEPRPSGPVTPPEYRFDFSGFMRTTRQEVEQLLAVGEIDRAEAYMNARRDELETHGYHLRRLNQAYFAFYGSYAESFAASPENPLPGWLRSLRTASPDLGAFLERIRNVTSVEELKQQVGGD